MMGVCCVYGCVVPVYLTQLTHLPVHNVCRVTIIRGIFAARKWKHCPPPVSVSTVLVLA